MITSQRSEKYVVNGDKSAGIVQPVIERGGSGLIEKETICVFNWHIFQLIS